MIGEPKVQSNLLFDYVVPNTDKLALSANLHYTGKRYADQRNVNAVPAYFTTDLGIRYVTKEWLGKQTTLRFNVNNVFDKKYWVGMFPQNYDGCGHKYLFRTEQDVYAPSGSQILKFALLGRLG